MESAEAITTLIIGAAGISGAAHVAMFIFWHARRAAEAL